MAPKNKGNYYNVEDFHNQKRHQQQERGARVPPRANVIAAACHIRSIFDGKKFEYGVFGGLAMLCLGSQREQVDVHIAYDEKDFVRLKVKLEGDQRYVVISHSFFDFCFADTASGSHGTPFNGTLHNNLVLLTLKPEGKLKTFKGLNILHLLKTSIHYCGVRDLTWDARRDVLYLCQNYGQDIQAKQNMLDKRAIKQNFLGTPFFAELPQGDQERCYQVLLGTSPPPRMAFTPPTNGPGHKPSASAPSVETRPRLSSHQSSPSLNAQISPGLLSPPLPGLKPAHKRAVSAEVRPSELPAPNDIRQAHGQQGSATRDSRSRYRQVSASISREGSPSTGSQSDNLQTFAQHKTHPSELASTTVDIRHVQSRLHHQSQAFPHLAPMQAVAHNRRSMPNMHGGYHGPLPPYAFAQTPSLNASAQPPHGVEAQFMHPVEMSATPSPMNPGQHHLKSQLGLAGPVIPIQPRKSSQPITERPRPPHARSSYQEVAAFRADLSGTPMPETHINRLHLVGPQGDLQCALSDAAGITSEAKGLHVVGPEGVFPAATEQRGLTPPGHDRTSAPTGLPVHAVELDATTPIGQFIAELSVDRATPAPAHEQPAQIFDSPLSPPESKLARTPHDSPISPPEVHAMPAMPKQSETTPVRPLNPRIQSAPANALPSSLMVGGPQLHTKPSSNIPPTPPATAPAEVTPPKTNASRYSRYYTSLSGVSEAPHHVSAQHPTHVPASTYQAYNPSVSTSPPRENSAMSPDTERLTRPLSFAALKDVDGANHYFKGHRRDKSHDSHASSASHDSRELAEEYRASLPQFEAGYGAGQ